MSNPPPFYRRSSINTFRDQIGPPVETDPSLELSRRTNLILARASELANMAQQSHNNYQLEVQGWRQKYELISRRYSTVGGNTLPVVSKQSLTCSEPIPQTANEMKQMIASKLAAYKAPIETSTSKNNILKLRNNESVHPLHPNNQDQSSRTLKNSHSSNLNLLDIQYKSISMPTSPTTDRSSAVMFRRSSLIGLSKRSLLYEKINVLKNDIVARQEFDERVRMIRMKKEKFKNRLNSHRNAHKSGLESPLRHNTQHLSSHSDSDRSPTSTHSAANMLAKINLGQANRMGEKRQSEYGT